MSQPTVDPRATTPKYGWQVPVLGDVPNVPSDLTNLALGIEATVANLAGVRGSVGILAPAYISASGAYTVPHSLGRVPTVIQLTAAGGNIDIEAAKIFYVVYDATSTTVRVQHNDLVTGATLVNPARRLAFYYEIG
jgi:hypothetical protein